MLHKCQGISSTQQGRNTTSRECARHFPGVREHIATGRFSAYCEIALNSNGNVASDCPRYCGRKPKRMIFPLPILNSTRAALPAIFSAPKAQPESNICFGSFG